MKKDAWIIIPVFNRRAVTVGALRHLTELGVWNHCEVVVADGGSTDGTPAAVREEFPAATVIEGDWWWTEAIRAGMEYARVKGAAIFIWLNDDSQPRAGSLERLIEHVRKTGRVCGGITFSQDGAYTANRRYDRSIKKIQVSECEGHRVIFADSLSGNFVAVPAACVEKIGLPDAVKFPHAYGDDAYTYMASQAGVGCDLLPEIQADDMQTSRTLMGASILRGSRPIMWHIKEQWQWNPRVGWLPALRFHELFHGVWGRFVVLRWWLKNWLLIGLRLLLPNAVRRHL